MKIIAQKPKQRKATKPRKNTKKHVAKRTMTVRSTVAPTQFNTMRQFATVKRAPKKKVTEDNIVETPLFNTDLDIKVPKNLTFSLNVTDPDVVNFLHEIQRTKGHEAQDEALQAALKIGVMALKNAQTKVDVQTIHNEVDRMVNLMTTQLESHNTLINESINHKLKEYFDPQSGRFEDRVNRLLRQDGELSNVMKQQIINTSSTLVRELTPLIGPGSRLLTALDPDSKQGVVGAIQWAVAEVTNEANKRILSEFSLDNAGSSLVRLVQELRKMQEQNNHGTEQYLKELSLDNKNSALNRLIATINESQNALSLDVKNSSMNRLRGEILDRIEQQNKQIANMEQFLVRELSVLNTQQNVFNQVSKRTTLHGLQFEQALFQFVSQIVNGTQPMIINGKPTQPDMPTSSFSSSDHIVEATGNRTGRIRNCKVGDIVITMGPEHVAYGSKIVIEAKNDQSYTIQKALDELAIAKKNRDAHSGIFVFGKGSQPENMENLKRYNNDLIVMWDAEDPVTNVYLDAAISISKALLVRRQVNANESNTSKVTLNKHLQKMKDLVGHIEQEMQTFDEIRRFAETSQAASEKILQKCKLRGTRAISLIEELNHEVMSAQTIANLLEQISTSPTSLSDDNGNEKM